ncbi:MAG TPA: DNA mismatch repair endonuclease MutL [Patescibacteria group bacterium]|nr:DNA mismatch repair endonuclease MutL [Patescibacteria group bacterium]
MQIKIRQLPPNIIAKIAAGEVIERPAYAVKELIENSIDAQATRIVIHLEEAGLKKITVTDNGIGMSLKDLMESFKLHTTSKLTTIDDLNHIASLGFRGEALASIAAISNLYIQSRIKKSVGGSFVDISEGKIVDSGSIGMPQGTTVIVSHLFYTVPARKKFLKSQQTEFRHILGILSHSVLSHPEISFVLTHNKKTIFDLPQTTNFRERLAILFGEKIITNLLPVFYQDTLITISGFIGTPQASTIGTKKQFLFVNRRSITDKLFSSVIKDSYETLLMKKTQPVFFLSLSLPFEQVDVNVHPRKEHVRFVDSTTISMVLHKAIAQTLAENNVTFYDETSFGISLGDREITQSYTGRVLKEQTIPWDIRVRDANVTGKEIVQMHNTYLMTQSRFGMLLVDQHAAHERILYEQFLEAFKQKKKNQPQFQLPKPLLIDLSFSDGQLMLEHLPLFADLGFTIEQFKDNTFLVQAIPMLFQDRNIAELVSEMLADLFEERNLKDIDVLSQKLIAYLACRAAVKAGESLTKKQAKDLIEKLEMTNNNATCPHGRPTKMIIDINQLHRMFRRK